MLSSLERAPDLRRTLPRDPPVHADEPAGAGPLDSRQGVRLPMSWRSSPPDASIRDSSSRPPASQPNVRGLESLRPLPRTRRDATFASLAKRRLLLESIRAPASLRKEPSLSLASKADPSRITITSEVRPLGDRRSPFAFAGSRSGLLRARCSHEASPCPRPSCRRERRRFSSDASMGAERPEHPTSAVRCDARAHPQELSILLRARLPPLSALSADSLACAAPPTDPRASWPLKRGAMPSAVVPATDLSAVALAKLASGAAGALTRWCRTRTELGDNWSAPGLTDTRHGSRPQSEGSGGDSRL